MYFQCLQVNIKGSKSSGWYFEWFILGGKGYETIRMWAFPGGLKSEKNTKIQKALLTSAELRQKYAKLWKDKSSEPRWKEKLPHFFVKNEIAP